MSVDTPHAEYTKMAKQWAIVRACACGHREVKKLGQAILPAPDLKAGKYDADRYESYKERAIYTNVTGRTKAGLSGAAFRNAPNINLSDTLDYLTSNADGSGQSLTQLAKDITGSMFCSGREALLVDFPSNADTETLEELQRSNAKAYIKRYECTDLLNWKLQNVNGENRLVMAVLREVVDVSTNEFERNEKYQYRVLRLDAEGYSQQLYDSSGVPATEKVAITQYGGERFDFIPLAIIGSQNNDASVDEIPLADIAHVNLGHYRNSADLEENCFIHGQLTLGVSSSMDSEDFKTANPEGIQVGARKGHFLGEDGAFTSVQANANQLADELMRRKEEQMIALGAKLVEKRNSQETATAARIDATGENSVLADIVGNIEDALRQCIAWCGAFMGDTGEQVFEMNREFFPDSFDATKVMSAIQLYDRGLIAKTDMLNIARRAEYIDESRKDEEVLGEVEIASPVS